MTPYILIAIALGFVFEALRYRRRKRARAATWQAERGTPEEEAPDQSPMRDLHTLLKPFEVPTVLLETAPEPTSSYLGGQPPAHDGFRWPEREQRPMPFLACIDLSSLTTFEWLPPSGHLLFFYDIHGDAWGFDPKDRGAWVVRHLDDTVATGDPVPFPDALDKKLRLPRKYVTFNATSLPPTWDHDDMVALQLSEAESDVLSEIRYAQRENEVAHQIGGFPEAVQDPHMGLECQLVTDGIYLGDGEWFGTEEAEALSPGAADWRLLLQFDSDDALNVMWGDAGMVYFWVREEEARRGNFSNVWLVFQCG